MRPFHAPTMVANSDNKGAADVAKSQAKGKKAASKLTTLCTPLNENDLPSAPNDSEPPPPKRAQQVQQTPKCEPCPNHLCNKHPGQPDQPCAKQSSAKVQAAKAELQAIQACEQEIEAYRIELYAQLKMEDEAEQVSECENMVKTLANVQKDGPESFSFSAVDAMSEEENGGNVVKGKSTKAQKVVS